MKNKEIKLSKSTISNQEMTNAMKVLNDEFLGMGPEVRNFEAELTDYIGNDVNVCTTNTGTSAIQLALQALGVNAGDEVLIPSLTYVATFQACSSGVEACHSPPP